MMTRHIRRKKEGSFGTAIALIILAALFMLIADQVINLMVAEPQFVDLSVEQRAEIIRSWK
jgi:hypothetical protein